jgi:hypothetical protein
MEQPPCSATPCRTGERSIETLLSPVPASEGVVPWSTQVCACVQVLVAVSHVSSVQALLSSQSTSKAQQPAFLVLAQVPLAVLHVSSVQGLLSAQSALVVQHPATGACSQTCEVVLQVSVVQLLPSLHWAALVQQPVTFVN